MAQYRLIICDLQFRLACMSIRRTIRINRKVSLCSTETAIFTNFKITIRSLYSTII